MALLATSHVTSQASSSPTAKLRHQSGSSKLPSWVKSSLPWVRNSLGVVKWNKMFMRQRLYKTTYSTSRYYLVITAQRLLLTYVRVSRNTYPWWKEEHGHQDVLFVTQVYSLSRSFEWLVASDCPVYKKTRSNHQIPGKRVDVIKIDRNTTSCHCEFQQVHRHLHVSLSQMLKTDSSLSRQETSSRWTPKEP